MSNKIHPEDRLDRLERRLNVIVVAVIIQTALLMIMTFCQLAGQLLPNTITLVIAGVATIAVLFLLRKQIPGWLGAFSRYIFGQFLESDPESRKDAPDEFGSHDP